MTATMVEPVRRSVIVNRSVQDTFDFFTERFGEWWPFEPHSIGKGKVETGFIEGRVGGQAYERWYDGTEHEWATVTEWEPPNRFVLSWYPSKKHPATEVEIRFTRDGEGTRVEVEHWGWEKLGAEAAEVRASYDGGWPTVLDHFARAANEIE